MRTKQVGFERPCDKMTEAIVMDGGKRGQIVRVCADLSCRVHHPDTPSPQQIERQRAEERKRIEKDKLAITTRHRILAAVVERVSEPLKKGDLLTVASYLIDQATQLSSDLGQTAQDRRKKEFAFSARTAGKAGQHV